MISKIRKKIEDISLQKFSPILLLKYRELRKKDFEPEFELLPYLCDKNKVSIDIGANLGSYTSRMIKYSKLCWAFEPIPQLYQFLSRAFQSTKIENVALSSKTGKTELKIPENGYALTSIEEKNLLEKNNIHKIIVEMKKLDDYGIGNVGFIKIDVEGHEEAVLTGAAETIKKYLPNLLIESEERHKPNAVNNIKNFLKNFGYQGFFLSHGKLQSIESFSVSTHQPNKKFENIRKEIRDGNYVNNFIFITKENQKKFSKFLD